MPESWLEQVAAGVRRVDQPAEATTLTHNALRHPEDGAAGDSLGGDESDVGRITAAQRPLYAYIRSLVGPRSDVDDILQEVNLVLWRKAAEYDGRGQYLTWACHVAYLQVLAHLKRRRDEKTVYFDEAVLSDLAGIAAARVGQIDLRIDALRDCLSRLPERSQRMLIERYAPGGSAKKIAAAMSRSAESVRVTLHRVRLQLLECVERKLGQEGSA